MRPDWNNFMPCRRLPRVGTDRKTDGQSSQEKYRRMFFVVLIIITTYYEQTMGDYCMRLPIGRASDALLDGCGFGSLPR